jgi:16S rRNA (cytosine1402-N4)-methyltransferase
MGNAPEHIPVLLGPAIEALRIHPGGVYVDATAGLGGHSEAIARQLQGGRLISLDRDPAAVAKARARLAPYPSVMVVQSNYGLMAEALDALGVDLVDGILLDAGVSSMQLDTADRGFSFQGDGPLDMRMDTTEARDAATLLADSSAAELAAVLRTFGDVNQAGRIASAIVRRREAGQLARTSDLVAAVKEALPFVNGVPEEVRTVFQAVRMAVNQELHWLEAGLRQGMDRLRPGARFVVISFHSGEDRVVKDIFREASRPVRTLYPDGRTKEERPPRLRVITPKPVQADATETAANPRAKSARMRVAERTEGGD